MKIDQDERRHRKGIGMQPVSNKGKRIPKQDPHVDDKKIRSETIRYENADSIYE